MALLCSSRLGLRVSSPAHSILKESATTTPRLPWRRNFDPAREDQVFTLPDQRQIGFAEYGISDGTPLFLFHGAPGVRWDGIGYHAEAELLNVRIICPDRPGHGLSTPQPNRTILDYPKDISALAEHLGLDKYHVAGQSGGAPYVAACAYASPENKLMNSTIIAGMVPPEAVSVKSAGYYTTLVLELYRWCPNVLRWLTDYLYPLTYWQSDEKVQKGLDFAYRFLPEEDRKEVANPIHQGTIRAILREAFRQGSVGTVQDAVIYGHRWGFRLQDVQKHIKLFFGRQDTRTPPAFGEYYSKHLMSSELTIFEDWSHFRIKDHTLDVIAAATGKEKDITPEMRVQLKEIHERIDREGY